MEIVDLLQDLAFNTGHRIMETKFPIKHEMGMLVVQKKDLGFKTIWFDQKTIVTLGADEAIEINLHDSNSINKIRGYLLNESPIIYNKVPKKWSLGNYVKEIGTPMTFVDTNPVAAPFKTKSAFNINICTSDI